MAHRSSLSSVFKGALGMGSASADTRPAQSAASQPKHAKAMSDLGAHSQVLAKRIEYLEKQAVGERELAKEFLKAGDKKSASLHLKKEANCKKQLEMQQNAQLNLESQLAALETTITNHATFQAMQAAKRTQEETSKTMNADDVAELMADAQEQTDQMTQVAELLGRANPDDVFLQDDIEAELAAMEAEEAPAKPAVPLPRAPSHAPAMPQVPTHTPAAAAATNKARQGKQAVPAE